MNDERKTKKQFLEELEQERASGLRGMVSLPLLANDRPVGVLRVWDKQVRHFTEDEAVNFLSGLLMYPG